MAIVREIQSRDYETIRGMDRQCFASTDDPYSFENCRTFGVFEGTELVAYLAVEPTGFVARVGVVPDFRGQGLQRLLIRHVMDWAVATHRKRLFTYTTRDNLISANNFLKCGWLLYRPDFVDDFDQYFYLQWEIS